MSNVSFDLPSVDGFTRDDYRDLLSVQASTAIVLAYLEYYSKSLELGKVPSDIGRSMGREELLKLIKDIRQAFKTD